MARSLDPAVKPREFDVKDFFLRSRPWVIDTNGWIFYRQVWYAFQNLHVRYRRIYFVMTPLLEQGLNVDAQDIEGRTPLFYAVRHSKAPLSIVQKLVQSGANVHLCDNEGANLLHAAWEANIINYLANLGISLVETDSSGHTPLHNASYEKTQVLFKYKPIKHLQFSSAENPPQPTAVPYSQISEQWRPHATTNRRSNTSQKKDRGCCLM